MQNTLAKLLGAWCALILSLPFAYLWLRPAIIPGHAGEVLLKLLVLLAAVGAIGLVFTYAISKRWAQRTELIENFADSLPGNETSLPGQGVSKNCSLTSSGAGDSR